MGLEYRFDTISLNRMKNQKGNIGVVATLVVIVGLVFFSIYSLLNPKEKTTPMEVLSSEVNSASVAENIITDAKKEDAIPSQKTMEKISKNGDTLVMNYTGRFTDGKTFDSNVDPKFNHVQPFEFKLGAGQVIKGWDEGLVGMKIGEKKTLTVPPEKGYGPNDYNGIPGGSTLIFDVELVGIK